MVTVGMVGMMGKMRVVRVMRVMREVMRVVMRGDEWGAYYTPKDFAKLNTQKYSRVVQKKHIRYKNDNWSQ